MSKSRPKFSFPYAKRAAAVNAARQACFAATKGLPGERRDAETRAAFEQACSNFRAALIMAYPPDFWEVVEKLKVKDVSQIDVIIEFLEADPMCFKSGHAKQKVFRVIVLLPLNNEQTERLRNVVLNLVDRRGGQEFRGYCKLAVKIEDDQLVAELRKRLTAEVAVARRARLVLEAIEAKRGHSKT